VGRVTRGWAVDSWGRERGSRWTRRVGDERGTWVAGRGRAMGGPGRGSPGRTVGEAGRQRVPRVRGMVGEARVRVRTPGVGRITGRRATRRGRAPAEGVGPGRGGTTGWVRKRRAGVRVAGRGRPPAGRRRGTARTRWSAGGGPVVDRNVTIERHRSFVTRSYSSIRRLGKYLSGTVGGLRRKVGVEVMWASRRRKGRAWEGRAEGRDPSSSLAHQGSPLPLSLLLLPLPPPSPPSSSSSTLLSSLHPSRTSRWCHFLRAGSADR
jgi:hypothetical protein